MRVSRLLNMILLLLFVLSGCGGADGNEASLERVIPPIPATADFGPLYPKLNELLQGETPDVSGAVQATRDWASARLPDINEGSCARTQIVYDYEFAQRFGPFTLGVTLPWMQIYIRDGKPGEETFVWKDTTLFVGTLLHEFVHAMQRARQARQFLDNGATSCESARRVLSEKRGTWNAGFGELKANRDLGDSYGPSDKALLYRWVSPIERARDELEAAAITVQWMALHPEELNVMTMGAATNWAYGAQYLDMLRTLASSNCFSSDEGTYQEEQRIYAEEIPRFAAMLEQHQEAMTYFLNQNGREPAVKEPISSLVVPAAPRGRDGHACVGLDRRLPSYPFSNIPGHAEPVVGAH